MEDAERMMNFRKNQVRVDLGVGAPGYNIAWGILPRFINNETTPSVFVAEQAPSLNAILDEVFGVNR
jgi:hypothetical protein